MLAFKSKHCCVPSFRQNLKTKKNDQRTAANALALAGSYIKIISNMNTSRIDWVRLKEAPHIEFLSERVNAAFAKSTAVPSSRWADLSSDSSFYLNRFLFSTSGSFFMRQTLIRSIKFDVFTSLTCVCGRFEGFISKRYELLLTEIVNPKSVASPRFTLDLLASTCKSPDACLLGRV